MCVYSMSEIKTLKKNTHYYKVVRPKKTPNTYCSLIAPRAMQTPAHLYAASSRNILQYGIGKEVTSDFETTPGMYCYINKEIAKARNLCKKLKVLKVLVKKGTRIRYASYSALTNDKSVVLVETLTPVKTLNYKIKRI